MPDTQGARVGQGELERFKESVAWPNAIVMVYCALFWPLDRVGSADVLSRLVNRISTGAALRATWRLASAHWAALVYALLAVGLTAWVSVEAFTVRSITYLPGTDYWEHSAALRALIEDPWSPGNPHLATDTPSPRYMPHYLMVALIARAAGFDGLGAMGLASLLNTLLLCVGVYVFFRSYFVSRVAPLIALCVLLCSWWDGWHYSNVYQLKLLFSVAAYPSTAAIGYTWLSFALIPLTLKREARWPWLLLCTLCFANVFLTHPLTAVATYVGAGFMTLFEPGFPWKTRAKLLGVLFGSVAVAHLWPYFSPIQVVLGGEGAQADWVEKSANTLTKGKLRRRLHKFYDFQDLIRSMGFAVAGIYFASALAALRKHLFIPLGALVMLLIFGLNAFVKIPLGHRFVLLALLFLHASMVWGILRLYPGTSARGGFLAKLRWAPLVLAVLIMSYAVHHNVDAALTHLSSSRYKRPSRVTEYARELAEAAGEHAVVFGEATDCWPVPTFGPKVMSLNHPNPLVPDHKRRKHDARVFFRSATTDNERTQLLNKYGATHVLSDSRISRAARRFLHRMDPKPVRLRGGYRLYSVRPREKSKTNS